MINYECYGTEFAYVEYDNLSTKINKLKIANENELKVKDYQEEKICEFYAITSEFTSAKDQGIIAKESNFHRWLRQANEIYQPAKSCLSRSFFDTFKRDYKISLIT